MEFTEEQLPAIHSPASKVRLIAFAGTGKTTTLVGYAKAHAQDRILYLVFNKSVEVEAKKRFPASNVTCKTSHGLAYPSHGARYQRKLANLRLMDISRALDSQHWETIRAVQETLNNFLASADDAVAIYHCPARLLVSERHRRAAEPIAALADRVWAMMLDEASSVPMSYDGFLKAWAISRPNLSRRFDTILVDEAQDLNPLLASVIAQQSELGVKVVVCG